MIKTIIKENLYLDSVFSMTAGRELKKLEGIKSATLVMGTDLNKSVLAEIGALTPEAQAATSNTLIIALETEKEGIEAEAEALLEKLLAGSTEKKSGEESREYKSVDAAFDAVPDANLVIISVAGEMCSFSVTMFPWRMRLNLNSLPGKRAFWLWDLAAEHPSSAVFPSA